MLCDHLGGGSSSADLFLLTPPLLCSSVKFDCCGVSGPEDFEESYFRLLNHNKLVPEACCQRNSYLGDAGVEQCVSGSVAFRHNKVSEGNTKFVIHVYSKRIASMWRCSIAEQFLL